MRVCTACLNLKVYIYLVFALLDLGYLKYETLATHPMPPVGGLWSLAYRLSLWPVLFCLRASLHFASFSQGVLWPCRAAMQKYCVL